MNALLNFLDLCSIELILFPITIRKRYFERPKLEISIEPCEGSYANKKWGSAKLSTISDFPLFVYEICWRYTIRIHNYSDYDAYYPKIHFDKVLPHYSHISVLNHYVPIKAKSTVELEGEYIIFEECLEDQNTVPAGIPKALKNLTLLVGYQNADKHQFYTACDFRYMRNTLLRYRPSNFR